MMCWDYLKLLSVSTSSLKQSSICKTIKEYISLSGSVKVK